MKFEKLALFGGDPTFSNPRHVNRPSAPPPGAFEQRVDAILKTRWFSNQGPMAEKLEAELAEFLGVGHCVATANGTVAMELVAQALGLGGEVIMPSYTFIATAHAFAWHGMTPVFCDVDPVTQNIDPAQVEALITPRTEALVGVHLWGRPCDIDGLRRVADKHQLALLFDAAHAFASSYQGQRVGGFGDAEVFSFHATKAFHCGEGGAVTTNDGELAKKVSLLRNFGFIGYDQTAAIGVNGKMSELSAALGLSNLEGLETSLAQSRRVRNQYRSILSSAASMRLPPLPESDNHHYMVANIDRCGGGLSRDQLVEILHAENIMARRYFYPGCHRLEPYASDGRRWDLPVTEDLGQTSLVLPSGSAISEQDVTAIAELLHELSEAGPEIRQAYEERLQPAAAASG